MFDKKAYYKKYYQKNKERCKGYKQKYNQKPEVKERLKEYQRKYLQRPEVKERKKEYERNYRQGYYQKPEIKMKRKETYERNKKNILLKQKERYEKNKEKVAAKHKKWYWENFELARARSRKTKNEWYKNPENKKKCLEYQRKKRLLDPIYKERAYIRSYSNHRYKAKKCYCCNGYGYGLHHYTEPYEIDKVIPLCSVCHKKVHDKVIQAKFTEEDRKKVIEQGYLQKL